MATTRQAVMVSTAAALAACYAPTLRGMFGQWSSDEDMSHGFVVPVLVLWDRVEGARTLARPPGGAEPVGLCGPGGLV